jgi:nucleoside-diphosphate-sugar epimerase
LRAAGIQPVPGDLDDAGSLGDVAVAGALVYYFAPPPSLGASDPRLETLVSRFSPPNLPERVVLISTTGVYGDCKGEWVTETRAPNPQTDRARRRLAAEQALAQWANDHGVGYVILRVPGIYGPGRLPEERLRRGEPVLREEEAPFSNRIHADDLARVCVAAARRGRPGSVYNVSDGHPSTMTDYFYRVARLLGLPRPSAISLEEARQKLSAGMISYLTESRRIDNVRMQEELGVRLRYPDLETGLPACVDGRPEV